MRSPYLITEPTCITFSGGRTSAFMLHKILEANDGLPEDAIVCFANTGKEEEATLEFVRDCSEKWNVPITWLEYHPETKFSVVDFDSASRNGEPFSYLLDKYKKLPNAVQRFCSGKLKINVIHNYLLSLGWEHKENENLLGIRADEMRRVAKIGIQYCPLAKDGVTKETVNAFWDKQDFNLNLLTLNGETIGGNCDLCHLKSHSKIVTLINDRPSRAIWWAAQEEKYNDQFRRDRPSYAQMLKYQNDQMPLFSDESIECFCGD